MKTKTFKNNMRFIIDRQWWRIHFPSREVQHRCSVSKPWGVVVLEWVRCQINVYSYSHEIRHWDCPSCSLRVPDDVVAHANLLGIKPPVVNRPTLEEQLMPKWEDVTSPKWVVNSSYTSSNSNDLILNDNSTTNET